MTNFSKINDDLSILHQIVGYCYEQFEREKLSQSGKFKPIPTSDLAQKIKSVFDELAKEDQSTCYEQKIELNVLANKVNTISKDQKDYERCGFFTKLFQQLSNWWDSKGYKTNEELNRPARDLDKKNTESFLSDCLRSTKSLVIEEEGTNNSNKVRASIVGYGLDANRSHLTLGKHLDYSAAGKKIAKDLLVSKQFLADFHRANFIYQNESNETFIETEESAHKRTDFIEQICKDLGKQAMVNLSYWIHQGVIADPLNDCELPAMKFMDEHNKSLSGTLQSDFFYKVIKEADKVTIEMETKRIFVFSKSESDLSNEEETLENHVRQNISVSVEDLQTDWSKGVYSNEIVPSLKADKHYKGTLYTKDGDTIVESEIIYEI